MANTIKLLGSEVALSDTASDIAKAKVLRIYNGDGSDQLVTVKDGATTVGTITVKTLSEVILEKNRDHTVEVAALVTAVKAVAIAYTN